MKRNVFFTEVRKHQYGGRISQAAVTGITAILDAWDKWAPDSDPRFIAYSLGTVYRECGTKMLPVRESGRGKGKKYGKPAGPHGRVYYGRGHVQLTWWENYKKADKRLHELGVLGEDEDLVKDPDLALRPDVAAPPRHPQAMASQR